MYVDHVFLSVLSNLQQDRIIRTFIPAVRRLKLQNSSNKNAHYSHCGTDRFSAVGCSFLVWRENESIW
jgi:hypothetical protein